MGNKGRQGQATRGRQGKDDNTKLRNPSWVGWGREGRMELWMLKKVGQQVEVLVNGELLRERAAGGAGSGRQEKGHVKSNFRNGDERGWSKTQVVVCWGGGGRLAKMGQRRRVLEVRKSRN